MIKAVFWDFGGVITTSPFESFNRFEEKNNLPKDFLRLVNSTNPDSNAWAKLERSEVNLDEFNDLFMEESGKLGYATPGKEVIALLKGEVRPQMINALKSIKNKSNIILAYEPVWSIGSGLIPNNEDLLKTVSFIKSKFTKKGPKILYGGSVNSKNITQLKDINIIDGFLVGGASQSSKKFIDIIKKTFN